MTTGCPAPWGNLTCAGWAWKGVNQECSHGNQGKLVFYFGLLALDMKLDFLPLSLPWILYFKSFWKINFLNYSFTLLSEMFRGSPFCTQFNTLQGLVSIHLILLYCPSQILWTEGIEPLVFILCCYMPLIFHHGGFFLLQFQLEISTHPLSMSKSPPTFMV